MPAALVAAGIGAAGSIGGSLIASRSAGKAADTQERASREAIQFEREREAQRQKQFEARERAFSPYRMAAASVLAKYGIEVPLEDEQPGQQMSYGAPTGPGQYTLGELARRPYGL